MEEIERVGRSAFERIRQVAEEGLGRAWAALQPLIEQALARLECLTILLRIVAIWLLRIWLEIQLRPVFDELGKAFAEIIFRLILIGFLLVLAGGFLFVVLAITVAIIVDRNSRRRAGSRLES